MTYRLAEGRIEPTADGFRNYLRAGEAACLYWVAVPAGLALGALAPGPRPRFGLRGLLPIGLPFSSTSV